MRNLGWNYLKRRILHFKHHTPAATSLKQPVNLQSTYSNPTLYRRKLWYVTDKNTSEECFQRHMSTDVSTMFTGTSDAQIEDKGRQLSITTDDGYCMKFHSVWLRYNCHCSSCKQEHSGQKMIDVADVNIESAITRACVTDNEVLELQWTDHEGEIPLEFLKENTYFENGSQDKFSWIGKQRLPVMTISDMTGSKNGVLKWLLEINGAGVCLLTDVPTEDKMVAKVAEHMAPIQHTIYGTTFEVRSLPNPINVAYSSANLDFHMDLVYYESPPGIQFLHCMQFDDCVEGGESLLLDVFSVAELFRIQHPEEFRTLTKIPATFQKVHYNRDYPVDMKYQRPHIVLNHKGEIVCVNWAPAFEGPLSVSKEDVVPYYKAYHKFAEAIKYSPEIVKLKLKPGDLLAFNNRRILHGRKEFRLNGGARYLQGCYVNIDEFKSQIHVLSTITADRKPVRNVGNQCWMTKRK